MSLCNTSVLDRCYNSGQFQCCCLEPAVSHVSEYKATGTINQPERRPQHYKSTLSSHSFISPARHNIYDELLPRPVNGLFSHAHTQRGKKEMLHREVPSENRIILFQTFLFFSGTKMQDVFLPRNDMQSQYI